MMTVVLLIVSVLVVVGCICVLASEETFED